MTSDQTMPNALTEKRGQVVMIGPALDSLGGMSSVAATYRESGLFERCRVRYLASYRHAGWPDKLARMAITLCQFAALLLRRQVALLHVHTASRGSFWRKSVFVGLARLFRVPVVLHIHSGEFMQFYGLECGRVRKALVRRVMRTSSCVLCLTPRWQQALMDVEPLAEILVLRNPVQAQPEIVARRMSGSMELGCVLFLGRLREKKGVFDLLRAWPKVLVKVPGARLVLAGDGDAQAILTVAGELGIGDSVDLPGWVAGQAKLDWLARASVFVLPSYAEGLPVGVLEAMICGIPVLATRVGGVPDIIEDGCDGMIIDAGDVSQLAAALSQLVCDSELRDRLARAARQRVMRDCSADLIVQQLEQYWSRAVTRGER